MVNSVLQGEARGGRARRLTVFDNGTLLVPAVGMGEEGEYTCYAENEGGQDMMKVKRTFQPGDDFRLIIFFDLMNKHNFTYFDLYRDLYPNFLQFQFANCIWSYILKPNFL